MKRIPVSAAALIVLFAGASLVAQKSEIVQKIIVKVNGEIFTQSELEFRQTQTLKDRNQAVRKPEDLATDPALIAALSSITPALLVDAVDELMLVQHGRELGIKFNDAVFKDALGRLKEANGIKDDAALAQALKGEGMTMADLRVNVERTFFVQTVTQRELMRNMTLTEEEARQYFNTHQSEFMMAAAITVREISVTVPTTMVNGQATINVAADEEAKQKLVAVRERAIKGEDFAKLVAEVSESSTKANGGLIGPLPVADLNPTLAALLEAMKPGDVSEPIRTKTGYQLIRLETRSSAQPETFEKSRDKITQKILESRMEVEKTKFIQKLLTQAIIEWKDDACKKMYDQERVARAKAGAPAPAGR